MKFGKPEGWHEWFAWYPVRLTDTRMWVWRELTHRLFFQIGPYSYTVYKSPNETAEEWCRRTLHGSLRHYPDVARHQGGRAA